MSNFAIGIGGTGAKCIESLIHLAAAGHVPGDDLDVLFVDPDGANGSLARITTLLSNYRSCREGRVAGSEFLKTKIDPIIPTGGDDQPIWNPISNGQSRLGDFFRSNLIRNSDAGYLLDLLFTQDEQETDLKVGFRGRPAIGAAVMANAVDLNNNEPWVTFRRRINEELGASKPVRIMLFASIFGGTGASGLPTIGRIIRDWINTFPNPQNTPITLGGCLMLPYFSFSPVNGETVAASSEDFLLNTQAALQYYAQQGDLSVFDSMYVLGTEDRLKMRESSIGGQLQENDSHFVELYAALAATSFFDGAAIPDGGNIYKMIARSSNDRLSWSDLSDDGIRLQQRLLQLTRFAIAFVNEYHPTIKHIADGGNDYRAPWFVEFFSRKGIDTRTELEHGLAEIRTYCFSYLRWLASIEYSISRNVSSTPNLVNFSAIATYNENAGKMAIQPRETFDGADFQDLRLPGKDAKTDFADLWERMCSNRSRGNSSNASWVFLDKLYLQCGH